MLKHHKFIAFILGLFFLIVIQKFATPQPVFRFLLPAFVFYLILVTLYNHWYLKQISQYNIWTLVRPILLLCAGFGIFLILPDEFLRGLFLIATVFVITFFEIFLGLSAENIILNETLLIVFGAFFYFFASFFYAPAYQPVYFLGIFAVSTLLARSFYELLPKPDKTKIVGSLAIGLFCGELYWVLNFLQFHYSVLSIILFNFFYFCLILNYYHLFHTLNLKKVQLHLFLMVACSLVVLLATPWNIVA